LIHIVTDSSCDLPDDLTKRYNIHKIPLTVTIDGIEYAEGRDIAPREFYEKMSKSANLPKTAQPSPAVFSKVFKELQGQEDEILCLTISSKLSGTYQSAVLAKEMSEVNGTVFDTLAGSLGQGLQAIRAAELAEQGFSIKQIINGLEKYRQNMTILILLDTLENIVKGGRLSRFQGSIAKVLNVKVLLQGVEGAVVLMEKVRGKKRFLERALQVIGEKGKDFSGKRFGITHLNNLTDAEFLKSEIIKRYNPKEVIVNFMGSTMGTYAGSGGIIISF
jgi:DegV family protein with EDD domain